MQSLEDGTILAVDEGDDPGLRQISLNGRVLGEVTGDDRVVDPVDLARDDTGRIYVLDRDGERVLRLEADLTPDTELLDLAERAAWLFNILHYVVRAWPWIVVALASVVIFPELLEPGGDPELGYPLLMLRYLPAGLLGLVVALDVLLGEEAIVEPHARNGALRVGTAQPSAVLVLALALSCNARTTVVKECA